MPNFSEETLERWRAERVTDVDVPAGLSPWQRRMMRETIDQDTSEELRRLAEAKKQIEISEKALSALRRKSNRLRRLYGV